MLLTASGAEQIKRLSPSISGLGRERQLLICNNCARCDDGPCRGSGSPVGDADARLRHLKLSAQQTNLRASQFQSQTRPIDGAVTKCNNEINCRGRQSSPPPFPCCRISFAVCLSEETQPLIGFSISRGRYCAVNMTDAGPDFLSGEQISQYEKH